MGFTFIRLSRDLETRSDSRRRGGPANALGYLFANIVAAAMFLPAGF
jgi:hypothetical protein